MSESLSSEHPLALEWRYNHAEMLFHEGRLDEAADIHRTVLAARRNEKFIDAELVVRELLQLAEKAVGKGNMLSFYYLSALSTLLVHQNRIEEAQAITLEVLKDLLDLSYDQGEVADAEAISRRMLASQMPTLGNKHLKMLQSITSVRTVSDITAKV
ncbi:hypothetical protein BJY01DRAFT_256506 [Aspergillus pseudoustus]|uniref:MalT-like TPR region domain-containing protein n=1 Tax=Aspergillus pseudoustus TaxID=1810923 RepID=A0ABR4I959_9EURO